MRRLGTDTSGTGLEATVVQDQLHRKLRRRDAAGMWKGKHKNAENKYILIPIEIVKIEPLRWRTRYHGSRTVLGCRSAEDWRQLLSCNSVACRLCS
jgi:hypothetical protein